MVNTLVLIYCGRPRHEPHHISLKHIFTRNLLFQSQQRKQEQSVKSIQNYGTILTHGSDDSIADFEQGNTNWDISFYIKTTSSF